MGVYDWANLCVRIDFVQRERRTNRISSPLLLQNKSSQSTAGAQRWTALGEDCAKSCESALVHVHASARVCVLARALCQRVRACVRASGALSLAARTRNAAQTLETRPMCSDDHDDSGTQVEPSAIAAMCGAVRAAAAFARVTSLADDAARGRRTVAADKARAQCACVPANSLARNLHEARALRHNCPEPLLVHLPRPKLSPLVVGRRRKLARCNH